MKCGESKRKKNLIFGKTTYVNLKLNMKKINVEFMLIIKGIMLLFQWGCTDLKMKFRKER